MGTPLLTIIVPTYNRSAKLEVLLRMLHLECIDIQSDVAIRVLDNCSSDDTAVVISNIKLDWPELQTHRHEKNIGAEQNFVYGVNSVTSRWFWILGDDDLPRKGLISQIIFVLLKNQPALLHMRSSWKTCISDSDKAVSLNNISVTELDSIDFVFIAHIWTTYISGMIIDGMLLKATLNGRKIDRYLGSNLVQLGWVLPLLRTAGPFILIQNKCILATAGNSGGFSLFRVFGLNYTKLVYKELDEKSTLAQILVKRNVNHFMPGLAWLSRDNKSASYSTDHDWSDLHAAFGRYTAYRLFVKPIAYWPKDFARLIYFAWSIYSRCSQYVGMKYKITLARIFIKEK